MKLSTIFRKASESIDTKQDYTWTDAIFRFAGVELFEEARTQFKDLLGSDAFFEWDDGGSTHRATALAMAATVMKEEGK